MREIKFRAYIKRDYNKELVGKILEVSSLHLKKNKVIIGYSISKSNYGNKSFNYKDIELMQYTGLKDKNRKEIYEGDVVKVFTNKEWRIGIIIYEHSGFTIDVTNNKELKYGRTSIIENLTEVIGNIYENPELLEKEE